MVFYKGSKIVKIMPSYIPMKDQANKGSLFSATGIFSCFTFMPTVDALHILLNRSRRYNYFVFAYNL